MSAGRRLYGVNTSRGRRRVYSTSPEQARVIVIDQGYTPLGDPLLLTMEMMLLSEWASAPTYNESGEYASQPESDSVETDGETAAYDDGGVSADPGYGGSDTSGYEGGGGYESGGSSYESGGGSGYSSSDSGGSYDSGGSDSGGGE